MWTAAILAGGQARRMGGRDKGALMIGGVRIIDRQVAMLRPVAAEVMIVANEPTRYGDLGVSVVTDLVPGAGALGGLYTALVTAATPHVVTLACDMPFVTEGFLRHLAALGREAEVAIPRTARGYEPLCASYARSVAGVIARRLAQGQLSLQGLLAEVRVREIPPEELRPFDPDGLLFFNINTPADYARALRYACGPPVGLSG